MFRPTRALPERCTAVVLLILAGGMIHTTPAPARAFETLLPGISSVAVNDDASALFTNPAAIDLAVPWGFYASWDRSEQGRSLDPSLLSLGWTGGALGLGFQKEGFGRHGRRERYLFALGGGARQRLTGGFRGAFEQRRVRSDSGTARSSGWRWDLGFLYRPAAALSLGALAADLNQEIYFGQPVFRSYTFGLGLRPLGGNARTRCTLSADLSGGEREIWREAARLAIGLELEPVAGIALSGRVGAPLEDWGTGRTYSIGAAVSLTRSISRIGFFFDGNERLARTVVATHLSAARQRTSFRRSVLAEIPIGGSYGDEAQRGLDLPIVGSPSWKSARPVLRQLELARKDPEVRGVLLEVRPITAGALAQEMRDGIYRIRASGKPVVAYLGEGFGWGQYYVASACDRIVLEPVSYLTKLGLRSDVLYYGEMLDSVGVQVEKAARGKYKTAGETLVRSRPSEGMLESLNSVLDDLREQFLSEVSDERRVPREKLDVLADGRIVSSPEALAEGLVDSLGDRRSAERILARLAGKENLPRTSIGDWIDREYDWVDGPKVAVLWLDGEIEIGESQKSWASANTLGSESVIAQLRALQASRNVKAVVLRVDSPGGSGLASDRIWNAVEELRKTGKKVVASMSRVAASGGYYISCGAEEIFAEGATITGSIGVLVLKPNLAGFYQHHRIHVETFERGGMMGIYSSAEPWDETERAHVQDRIDLFYDHFLDRVAAGRPLSREEVDEVAQGRIWTGRQALERKLIDRVGGLEDAIARARELAGLSAETKVVHVRRPRPSWIERILLGDSGVMSRGFRGALGLGTEESEAGAAWTGLSPSDATPLNVWFLRRTWRETQQPGASGGFRAENPLLEGLLSVF